MSYERVLNYSDKATSCLEKLSLANDHPLLHSSHYLMLQPSAETFLWRWLPCSYRTHVWMDYQVSDWDMDVVHDAESCRPGCCTADPGRVHPGHWWSSPVYTRRINFRKNWRRHIWQKCIASFPLDETHLLAAVRNVDMWDLLVRLNLWDIWSRLRNG